MEHQTSHLDDAVSALSDGRLRVTNFPVATGGVDGTTAWLRGLQATRGIAPGEPLMSIPVDLMLLPPSSQRPHPSSVSSRRSSSELQRQLALALSRVLAGRPAEAAAAPAAVRACLTGDAAAAAAAAVVERRLLLRAETLALKLEGLGHSGRLLADRLAGVAEDWLAARPEGCDRRLWLASCQLVNTRVVHIPGLSQIALVPYFDLFNHSPLVEVETAFDAGGGRFTLTTRTGYSPGDQVYINYGCHSNLTLLVEYDFVLGPAPSQHDCVPVDIAALDSLMPATSGQVADFLEQLAGLGMCPPAGSVLSNPAVQLKYFHLSVEGPSYYLLLLMATLDGVRSLPDVVQSMSEDQLIDGLRQRLRHLYGELKLALIRDRNLYSRLGAAGQASDNLVDNCVRLLDTWCDIVAALMEKTA